MDATLSDKRTSASSVVAPTRRDFLYIATGSFAVVAAGATVVSLVDQMNPDAAALASGGPVDIDLSGISPGQQIIAKWRGNPVFIVNRTEAQLKTLTDPNLIAQLSNRPSSVALS